MHFPVRYNDVDLRSDTHQIGTRENEEKAMLIESQYAYKFREINATIP